MVCCLDNGREEGLRVRGMVLSGDWRCWGSRRWVWHMDVRRG